MLALKGRRLSAAECASVFAIVLFAIVALVGKKLLDAPSRDMRIVQSQMAKNGNSAERNEVVS